MKKQTTMPTAGSASQPSRNSPTASPPVASGWLDGTLVLFEPSRELLFVRSDENRKKLVIHWGPETQFVLDGQPASEAALQRGQRVHIHFRHARHELSADHIALEPSAMAEPARPTRSAQHRLPSNRRDDQR